MLERAKRAVAEQSPSERDVSAVTLAVDPALLPEVKARIAAFRKDITQLSDTVLPGRSAAAGANLAGRRDASARRRSSRCGNRSRPAVACRHAATASASAAWPRRYAAAARPSVGTKRQGWARALGAMPAFVWS
jgi:hypothetical protein